MAVDQMSLKVGYAQTASPMLLHVDTVCVMVKWMFPAVDLDPELEMSS